MRLSCFVWIERKIYWTDAAIPEYLARANVDGSVAEKIVDDDPGLSNNFDLTLDLRG